MKEIILSKGLLAQVDDEDYEFLSQWKWTAAKARNTYYAMRGDYENYFKGRRPTIIMHRVIMRLTDKNLFVDHIDGNGLNNQRGNLRICNLNQNSANRIPLKNLSSKYLGVSWSKQAKKWVASLVSYGKHYHLGYFVNEDEAYEAYKKKAHELHGEFASRTLKQAI